MSLIVDAVRFSNDITFEAQLLSPGTGTDSFKAGPGALAGGTGSVTIGHDATSLQSGCVYIGNTASGTGLNSTGVGRLARTNNADNATALGSLSQVGVGHNNSVALGSSSLTTAVNQLMIGHASVPLNVVIAGTGDLQCGNGIGVWGTTPPGSQPTVIGSRGGNAALTSLLTTLAATGLFVDGTSA